MNGFFGSLHHFASKQYKRRLLFAPGPPLSFSFGHLRDKICAGRVTEYVFSDDRECTKCNSG